MKMKVGKVCGTVEKMRPLVLRREECCTRLVHMRDGQHGRRAVAQWRKCVFNDDITTLTYTVYLFGPHYPGYVWDERAQAWYGNSDKYSNTTTRYMSVLRPPEVTLWFETVDLVKIADMGITAFVADKMARAERPLSTNRHPILRATMQPRNIP